jgi:hypothetical protein
MTYPVEREAAIQHKLWSKATLQMAAAFNGVFNEETKRLVRIANTEYKDLTEEEKEFFRV